MILIRSLRLEVGEELSALQGKAAKALGCKAGEIRELKLVKRSLDARKKNDIHYVCAVAVSAPDEGRFLRRPRKDIAEYKPPVYAIPQVQSDERPVVVGFGPAGMFAALVLARAGARPIVLERGQAVEQRTAAVEAFRQGGPLDPENNVQFGEGGAGTFSDGKLNTGTHDKRMGWVLQEFHKHGAPESVTYDAKPHVGTDVLVDVVRSIRQELIALGGEVRFCTQVTGLEQENGELRALMTQTGERIPCEKAVLAIGHSARDTFSMLEEQKIPMEPKPFSMGVRIEHLQKDVNRAQYGAENPALPPADYKLVKHLDQNTVYTFCMCPGGYVVAAASEPGGVVTNGMSNADRAGENANAALLVTLNPEIFPYPGNLGGMRWQREIEQRAYQVSGSYRAPAQRVGDFLDGHASTGPGSVSPTYRPGVTWCDLHEVLPEVITRALEQAIPALEGNLAGFSHPDGVLTAPETRSSSPVRILRDETRQSRLKGLYPCGEGAGYAGGIMSAAVDGILTAEAVLGI